MREYKIKTGRIEEKAVGAYKAIEGKFIGAFLEEDKANPTGYTLKTGKMADRVTSAYKKVENAFTGGYKKIENAFTGSYKKIENAFVEKFLDKSYQN